MSLAILLSVLLTNSVQEIDIPIVPCRDNAVMSGYFHGDGTNMYGITMEALDQFGQVVASSWVEERYVPSVSETVGIALTPNVVKVRCIVNGPNPEKVFSDGKFTLYQYQPSLRIQRFNSWFYLTWFDPEGCYWLERNDGKGWYRTSNISKVINFGNAFTMWRLNRLIEYRPYPGVDPNR